MKKSLAPDQNSGLESIANILSRAQLDSLPLQEQARPKGRSSIVRKPDGSVRVPSWLSHTKHEQTFKTPTNYTAGKECVRTTEKPEVGLLPARAHRKKRAQAKVSAEILIEPPNKQLVGYVPQFITQFGLPHRPVVGDTWVRHNGDKTLRISSNSGHGIPSGSKPRLLLAWVATWQVRNPNESVIELGRNVSQFLEKELLLPRTGAYIKAIKAEMVRLFTSTVSITTEDQSRPHFNFKQVTFADEIELWNASQDGQQDAIFHSHIILTERFRQSLLANPVPLDLRAFPILTPSPLSMDLYVWLAYTMFTLAKPRQFSWEQLHMQFGANYDLSSRFSLRDFQRECTHQLRTRILDAYPKARISFDKDGSGITLHPSPTPVPPSKRTIVLSTK